MSHQSEPGSVVPKQEPWERREHPGMGLELWGFRRWDAGGVPAYRGPDSYKEILHRIGINVHSGSQRSGLLQLYISNRDCVAAIRSQRFVGVDGTARSESVLQGVARKGSTEPTGALLGRILHHNQSWARPSTDYDDWSQIEEYMEAMRRESNQVYLDPTYLDQIQKSKEHRQTRQALVQLFDGLDDSASREIQLYPTSVEGNMLPIVMIGIAEMLLQDRGVVAYTPNGRNVAKHIEPEALHLQVDTADIRPHQPTEATTPLGRWLMYQVMKPNGLTDLRDRLKGVPEESRSLPLPDRLHMVFSSEV